MQLTRHQVILWAETRAAECRHNGNVTGAAYFEFVVRALREGE